MGLVAISQMVTMTTLAAQLFNEEDRIAKLYTYLIRLHSDNLEFTHQAPWPYKMEEWWEALWNLDHKIIEAKRKNVTLQQLDLERALEAACLSACLYVRSS